MMQHRSLRLLPARQRPDRQGSAAAPLWCIRPRFSARPPGRPALPPFPNPGGLPGRPVGGGVFSSPGAQTSPFWCARGGRSLDAFFLRAPGTCPGQNGASKGGKAWRTAKNRGEPAASRKKNTGRTARAQNGVQRRFGAHGRQRMPEPAAVPDRLARCRDSFGRQPTCAAILGGSPRRWPGPAAGALLPLAQPGESQATAGGGYAQRRPRAVLL